MKNASEIILALNIQKDKYTMEHAGKLAAIYRFFASEIKDIFAFPPKPEEMFFGRKAEEKMVNREWVKHIVNDGIKMPGERFSVTTHRGNYSVVVPTGNKVHEAFCKLLNVGNLETKPEVDILYSFTFPSEVLDAIKKARGFVGKDDLRPATQCVCIEIDNKFVQIVSTDCHQLYMSQPVAILGPPEKHQFLINATDLKRIPKSTDEPFEFNILKNNVAMFGGLEVPLLTGAMFPQWKVVVPEYKQGMTFNRTAMISKVKEVLPYANKCTSQVNFYLNGSIEMSAQDVDFSFESKARLSYLSKEFPDVKIGFNGKFLLNGLSIFSAEKLTMLSDGLPERCAIFTDGIDRVLVMPLVISPCLDNEHESVELDPEPPINEKRKNTSESKSARIFASYLDWLYSSGAKVFVHVYDDYVNIRYIKGIGRDIIKGTKRINRTVNDQSFILSLASVTWNYDQKLIYKTTTEVA
jgi:hypothetical protein